MGYYKIRKMIEEYIKEKGVKMGLQDIHCMIHTILLGLKEEKDVSKIIWLDDLEIMQGSYFGIFVIRW